MAEDQTKERDSLYDAIEVPGEKGPGLQIFFADTDNKVCDVPFPYSLLIGTMIHAQRQRSLQAGDDWIHGFIQGCVVQNMIYMEARSKITAEATESEEQGVANDG
jgi:hypothetical protein